MGKFGHQTFTRIRLKGGTDSYILSPVLTETQRDLLTAAEGMIIFNSTTDQLEEYDGSTWQAVGQVIMTTHEALGTGIHEITKVVKTVDEVLNNDETHQNDDELLLAVEANTKYWFFLLIYWTQASNAMDLEISWAVPSGSLMHWCVQDDPNSAIHQGSSLTILSGSTGNLVVMCLGSIECAATAGNIQLKWAQNTATVGDLTVRAGSMMMLIKAS